MRLLIVSNLFPPRVRGGYELACYNIARGLIARGHDVRVLTTETELVPEDDQSYVNRGLELRISQDVETTSPSMREFYDYESMVSLRHNTVTLLTQLREFRPDHVVLFNVLGLGGLAIIDALNFVGAPWTFNLGDNVPATLLENVDDEMAAIFGAVGGRCFRTGQIAAISQSVVDEIEAAGVTVGDHVRIITRGVIPHGLTRTRDYQEAGRTRFVSAGTLGPHKGIDIMVDAVRLLKNEPGQRDFVVDVYGEGTVDGYQLEDYARLAREAGVSDVMVFHGAVSQLAVLEAEAAADAFLFPTWEREALGNAPLEAASVGCVPIITATCGAAERLVDGIHCVKAPRNAVAFAEAMRRVCDGEVDLASIGQGGQRLSHEELSFDRSLGLLEAFVGAGARDGWQDLRLDDAEVAAELVARDNEALALRLSRRR